MTHLNAFNTCGRNMAGQTSTDTRKVKYTASYFERSKARLLHVVLDKVNITLWW